MSQTGCPALDSKSKGSSIEDAITPRDQADAIRTSGGIPSNTAAVKSHTTGVEEVGPSAFWMADSGSLSGTKLRQLQIETVMHGSRRLAGLGSQYACILAPFMEQSNH